MPNEAQNTRGSRINRGINQQQSQMFHGKQIKDQSSHGSFDQQRDLLS